MQIKSNKNRNVNDDNTNFWQSMVDLFIIFFVMVLNNCLSGMYIYL